MIPFSFAEPLAVLCLGHLLEWHYWSLIPYETEVWIADKEKAFEEEENNGWKCPSQTRQHRHQRTDTCSVSLCLLPETQNKQRKSLFQKCQGERELLFFSSRVRFYFFFPSGRNWKSSKQNILRLRIPKTTAN